MRAINDEHLNGNKHVFDGCVINGVRVHAIAAFDSYETWYDDLIGRAIPSMGTRYINLFIDCKFHEYVFLHVAQKMDSGEYAIFEGYE